MAYKSWTTPSGLLSGGRSASYSMAGPGNRAASVSALRSIANPTSVASIASPAIPSNELPFSTDPVTSPIAASMRAPGPVRTTAALGKPEGIELGGDATTRGMNPALLGFGQSQQMATWGAPKQPQVSQPSFDKPAPALIAGNPAAIADWRDWMQKNPGMGFTDWMQAPAQGPGSSNAYKWV